MEDKYVTRENRIQVLTDTLDQLIDRMDSTHLTAQDFASLVRESRQISKELREESVPFDEHREKALAPWQMFVEDLVEKLGK